MRSIKAIYDSFWNKDDSFQNEAEMFRNIVCTGISRNRLCYNSIVTDKLVIEIIKTKEGLDLLYSARGLLIIDYFNLLRVNFNSIYTYNKPKVLRAFYPKFILLNINL
jgi:hypothetical protein